MFGEGRYIPPEAQEKQLTPPVELTSESDIIQFWLTFRRNNGLADKDGTREQRLATLQAKKTMQDLENNPSLHLFGIKEGESMVATGKLEVRTKPDGKHGYLAFLAVDESQRGKGLAKKLTDVRTDMARQEGCTHIDTDVFTQNSIALVTKLNDGYALTDVEFYGDEQEAGKFLLSKKIEEEPEYDKKDGPLGALQEVSLSDLSTIKNLVEKGWVGIDAKNVGDAQEKDPKQWILIMEQTKK